MALTVDQVIGIMKQVSVVGDTILTTVSAVDPSLSSKDQEVEGVVDLFAQLASIGLTAYSQAAGIPITDASILALKSNPAPLDLPTE